MLNKEKYAKEIIEVLVQNNDSGLAVVKGKPVSCNKTECKNCDFCDNCADGFANWANSEYVEPPVDWSKVPVDTPILVKNFIDVKWEKRYFAKYEDGKVHAWNDGTTSWTAHSENHTIVWKYAKLAEEE